MLSMISLPLNIKMKSEKWEVITGKIFNNTP
jgi:hypothetical protein